MKERELGMKNKVAIITGAASGIGRAALCVWLGRVRMWG